MAVRELIVEPDLPAPDVRPDQAGNASKKEPGARGEPVHARSLRADGSIRQIHDSAPSITAPYKP
jgi:hypothetical protein